MSWPEGISDGLTLPCSCCGEVPRFDYRVRDDVWRQLVPAPFRRGVICLPCLDSMAVGVDVCLHIEHFQFIGSASTLVMEPSRVIDLADGETKWTASLQRGEG